MKILRLKKYDCLGCFQFASNELYLTGESYAGIYVPTLAEQIMFGQDRGETVPNGQPMNLQGIMVGNGCTGTSANDVSQEFFEVVF